MSNGTSDYREKDFGEHLSGDMEADTALQKIRTAGSLSISPELFEKLYLSPRDAAGKSGIRSLVGNPTPIAIVGFLLALSPLSCDLMGWRGAGHANGSASMGAYFFFGGLLMIIGAVGEFIVGSTFPAVVFSSFGAFWLTFGATLQDGFYGAQSNYAVGAASATEAAADFYNAYAFFLLWMGVLCLIYLICALRINVVFCIIFFSLILAFGFLSGAFWQYGQGNVSLGAKLTVGGGACAFVTCVAGWYLLAAILLATLDYPFALPVGDLSSVIKGGKDKMKDKV